MAAVDDKAHYYPGSEKMMIKLICDRGTHKLLGMQALGNGAVDKMTDIAVTAISMGGLPGGFAELRFCLRASLLHPPSHPFAVAVNTLLNKLSGKLESFTPAQYAAGEAEGYTVLDVAIQPVLKDAPYIQLNQVNGPLEGHPLDEKLLLVCSTGKRTYLLQNRLKHFGYTNTRILEGGVLFNTQLQG